MSNDPIVRVAQRWAGAEYASLADDIRHHAKLYVAGEPTTPGEWIENFWVPEFAMSDSVQAVQVPLRNEVNRAVAEWLRGVADGLDPPRCPDGVEIMSDTSERIDDALDADGGVVVSGKEPVR